MNATLYNISTSLTYDQGFREGMQAVMQERASINWKIPLFMGVFVILQGFRAYYQIKLNLRLEDNKITLDEFLKKQFLLGLLDMACYPLAIFLIFASFF